MKYKISENQLKLREYGRNVQQMVEYARTIEDREKRSQVAHEIVRIMNSLNPAPKDSEDYRRKLWDHLFLIAEYDLDIEAPYPIPQKGEVLPRPSEPMGYYRGRPRFRQYGKNVELMIEKCLKMEDEEKQKAYINLIGNTMLQFMRNIDRGSTPESVIAQHINELSDHRLKVNPDDLRLIKINQAPIVHQSAFHNGGSSRKSKKKTQRKWGSKGRSNNKKRGRY